MQGANNNLLAYFPNKKTFDKKVANSNERNEQRDKTNKQTIKTHAIGLE